MRITAGRFKGRRLASPKGDDTRPTSDRVRQAIFNVLSHSIEDFTLDNARVLDLFAGTGALGLEALSRGATYAVFVDHGTPARAALRENIETLQVAGVTRVLKRDATAVGDPQKLGQFNLAFLDPPYGKGLAEQTLTEISTKSWLVPGAICVIEETTTAKITTPPGFEELDTRIYGDTSVHILRWNAPCD